MYSARERERGGQTDRNRETDRERDIYRWRGRDKGRQGEKETEGMEGQGKIGLNQEHNGTESRRSRIASGLD